MGKSNGTDTKNVYLYTGHDSTVSMLLCTLGVYVPDIPEYAAAVVVELLEEDNDYYVQLSYKNETYNKVAHILSHPNCTTPCPLATFQEIMAPFIPGDVEKECNPPDLSRPPQIMD